MKGAENKFAAIEDLTDEELEKLHHECRVRADMTLEHIEGRKKRSRSARGNLKGAAKATARPSS